MFYYGYMPLRGEITCFRIMKVGLVNTSFFYTRVNGNILHCFHIISFRDFNELLQTDTLTFKKYYYVFCFLFSVM